VSLIGKRYGIGMTGGDWQDVHRSLDAATGQRSARFLPTPQGEYDTDPQLRELLAAAALSPTVRRSRDRRT
jgi:hypothetical protein